MSSKLFLNKVVDVTHIVEGKEITEKFFVSEDDNGEYVEIFTSSENKDKVKIYLSDYDKNDIL